MMAQPVGIRLPSWVTIPSDATIKHGQFLSDKKWVNVDKIVVDGHAFDSKTGYVWDDSDFPSDDQDAINDAIKAAKKAREKNADSPEVWGDYLDYSKGTYSFMSEGFMLYLDSDGLNIDAMPKGVGLGRIPITDLQDENGSPILQYDTEKRLREYGKQATGKHGSREEKIL